MKKFTIALLSLMLCFSLFACGNDNKDTDADKDKDTAKSEAAADENAVKIDRNIDAVAKHLGLKDGSETMFSMIGAKAGKEYNGGEVELYEFDEESKDYETIKDGKGSVEAAAYEDGIILVFPNEKDDKIIKKFKEIDFN